ncbi:GlsB/YeaQ/YmgE family stress response membrane protein [Luteolibacter sp. AS25]|uniref:GlsB/YeaQ/YmgE family stress response membrane protein n=1 Tax=Luteolibacter sp. AS25 TaxID=3135776 RepID=UPI00398A8C5B
MDILIWILLGLIAGILGKILLPGKDPGGWIITILLGIGGAFVGGWVGSFFGMGSVGGLSLGSIVTATIGAILLLLVYRMVKR